MERKGKTKKKQKTCPNTHHRHPPKQAYMKTKSNNEQTKRQANPKIATPTLNPNHCSKPYNKRFTTCKTLESRL